MAHKKRYHHSKQHGHKHAHASPHHHGKHHKSHVEVDDGMMYSGRQVRDMRNEFYAGLDPRRRMELEDSRMIHEDHRAPANLPQQVMYHEWAHEAPYLRYHLDDTLRGIDHQVSVDDAQTKRHFQKGKY